MMIYLKKIQCKHSTNLLLLIQNLKHIELLAWSEWTWTSISCHTEATALPIELDIESLEITDFTWKFPSIALQTSYFVTL